MATSNHIVRGDTVTSITANGRKYITSDSYGAEILWSSQANGPWHRETINKGIDLPNVPLHVKSAGRPIVLTVTVYDS